MLVIWRTNFGAGDTGWIGRAVAGLLIATGCLVVTTVWISSDIRGRVKDTQYLEQRIAVLQRNRDALDNDLEALPDEAEIAQVAAEARRFAPLVPYGGATVNEVMTALEEVLPESARLEQLHWRGQNGELRFVAIADTRDTLTSFLRQLEGAPVFTEALLLEQATLEDGAGYRFLFRVQSVRADG